MQSQHDHIMLAKYVALRLVFPLRASHPMLPCYAVNFHLLVVLPINLPRLL